VADGYIRIGELTRRTGVSPELLRAWERRYGLFEPDRSPGRFRLYSDADVARVVEMKSQLADGLSAAEAARRVLAEAPDDGPRTDREPGVLLDEPLHDLRTALTSFDDVGANAALDQLVASLSLESLLGDVALPMLREIGEGWERGEITVAQEHFASNLLRGRLLALGRGWGRGAGRHALLAAPAGEQHDLGLVVLALALRDRGWRVTFLGADTPIDTVGEAAQRVAPEVVVLATLVPPTGDTRAAIRTLVRDRRVVLAGAGISHDVARALGAEHFAEGPIEAATYLTNGARR
jgi:MerR family transcriptional regulator, light-induced transcriptional regulator